MNRIHDRNIPSLDIYPNFQSRLVGKVGIRRALLTALPFIPRHAYHPFACEIRNAFRRLYHRSGQIRKRFRNDRGLMVNVGCGASGQAGWVNLDLLELPGVTCVYDCRKSLPFADESVSCIFTEHFLEHIDYCEEIPCFISECYRVLEPGGVIRIIVPDAEKYIRAYCEADWPELARIRPLGPERTDTYFGSKYHTKMELLNVIFRQDNEHKFAYDFATLQFVLQCYGFSQVCQKKFRESSLPQLGIDRPERASESLRVEAVKDVSNE